MGGQLLKQMVPFRSHRYYFASTACLFDIWSCILPQRSHGINFKATRAFCSKWKRSIKTNASGCLVVFCHKLRQEFGDTSWDQITEDPDQVPVSPLPVASPSKYVKPVRNVTSTPFQQRATRAPTPFSSAAMSPMSSPWEPHLPRQPSAGDGVSKSFIPSRTHAFVPASACKYT